MDYKIPRIAVATIILKGKEVLLGKRLKSHGAGTWSFPGGHLEFNESLEACAKRKVREETGLKIILASQNPVAVTNDIFQNEQLHYITLYMKASYVNGTPKIIEPDKCKEWVWFPWGSLPEKLFLPVKNLIKQGYNPFS